MLRLFKQLLDDEQGVVITTELIMIATIVTLAMVVGLTEVSHAVTGELIDVANSYNSMNQGRRYQNLGWNNNSSNGNNWNNSIAEVTGTPARDEDQYADHSGERCRHRLVRDYRDDGAGQDKAGASRRQRSLT